MASTKCVLFVSLILRAILSLPISKDIKSVQSLDKVAVDLTDRTFVFHPNTILSSAKDIEQVNSLGSVTIDAGVKRTKREIIVGNNSCAQEMVRIWNMCVTLEKRNELKEDYEDEITPLPEDKSTTSRPLTTPRPRPTRTPRHRMSPRSQKTFPLCRRRRPARRRENTRCHHRHSEHPDDVKQCRRHQRRRRRHRRHRKNRRAACQFIDVLGSFNKKIWGFRQGVGSMV